MMSEPVTPFAEWETRMGFRSASETAEALNITRQAVDLLRKGQRKPRGPLRRLMTHLENNPELLRQLVSDGGETR